jgi:hypothetical protein
MPVPVELLRFFERMAPASAPAAPPPEDTGDAEVAEAEAEISGAAAPEIAATGTPQIPPAPVPELDDSAIPPVPDEVANPGPPPAATGKTDS